MKIRIRIAAAALVTIVVTFAACSTGGTVRNMQSSATVPGAEGELALSDGGNQNTEILVSVKHLADPRKLRTGATNYIVWSRPFAGNGEPQNLGALDVDENLNGRLRTVTPFRQFSLFITAEPAPNVVKPSGEPLLWTNVSRTAE